MGRLSAITGPRNCNSEGREAGLRQKKLKQGNGTHAESGSAHGEWERRISEPGGMWQLQKDAAEGGGNILI